MVWAAVSACLQSCANAYDLAHVRMSAYTAYNMFQLPVQGLRIQHSWGWGEDGPLTVVMISYIDLYCALLQ
jgi:hypothetical protein